MQSTKRACGGGSEAQPRHRADALRQAAPAYGHRTCRTLDNTKAERHRWPSRVPSAETLDRFVARVEAGAHAEAIAEFYVEHGRMRENQGAPRVGRAALVAHEQNVLSRASSVESICVRPILADGTIVVIRWIFRFRWLNGTVTEMEELAYQRWEGEQIAEEQFFYDPAQLQSKNPSA